MLRTLRTLALPATLLAGSPALAGDAPAGGGGSAAADTADAPDVAPAPEAPAAKPVQARFVLSHFADLPVSGDADPTLRLGGKFDMFVNIRGSAFGMDDSIRLHFQPEFKYGESANGTVGLLPTNSQLFYPGRGEEFDLSASVTKVWSSGTSLTVGKMNLLSLAEQVPVLGGGGHEGFQNLAMALPPTAVVPGSITGAMLNVPTKAAFYRLWVFDARSQSRRSGFEDPFGDGVAALGAATVPVRIAGRSSFISGRVIASTRSRMATEGLPPVLIPAPGSGFGNRKGELAGVLSVYHYVAEYPEAPGKGIALFGQVFASNGDPTFLDRSAFAGVIGHPRGRPQDKFGIAWFRYSITDSLVSALSNRVALQDEEGVEAFYTLEVAKRLRVSANVQVVDSAVTVRDTGVIAGLRISSRF
ncbi:carbohydrate porin [Leptolyngbya sp. 15MV]|nr:carbohydrate porin [Leptolyngbya sp. 15MV]